MKWRLAPAVDKSELNRNVIDPHFVDASTCLPIPAPLKLVSPEGISPSVSWGFLDLLLKTLVILFGSCSSKQYQSATHTRSPASLERALQVLQSSFCDTNPAPFPTRFSLCSVMFELCDLVVRVGLAPTLFLMWQIYSLLRSLLSHLTF